MSYSFHLFLYRLYWMYRRSVKLSLNVAWCQRMFADRIMQRILFTDSFTRQIRGTLHDDRRSSLIDTIRLAGIWMRK